MSWFDRAACRGMSVDLFIPTQHKGGPATYEETRPVCDSCEVKTECLNYAVTSGEHLGMWGGTTPRERFRMRGLAA